MVLRFWIIVTSVLLGSWCTVRLEAKCGYESCSPTRDGYLNVHLVPHSHMDLGWLKTVDQYYFGTRATIMNQAVQNIYDSVLRTLEADPKRRFIVVETGFFIMWWNRRPEPVRNRFRKLVMDGRVEFVSGGYVMNDEATVHYSNTIDQMTYGLRILEDLFGEECGVPKTGWQIDPFGHSIEFATILQQIGIDAFFLGRLDFQDKLNRQTTKTMEFMWQTNYPLSSNTTSQLFTLALPNVYAPPPGFCFDAFCTDEVLVDDETSPEYNIDTRLNQLFDAVKNQSSSYATNHIILTMGEDFMYQDAYKFFENMDKLIQYGNAKQDNGSRINFLYSTPSCYARAVKTSQKKNTTNNFNWSVKTDDMFPYASDAHAYWTGYFTSRPAFKRLDRHANNVFQAAKTLGVMANNTNNDLVSPLRISLAIGQHHDAVSGTARQHVNNDYTKMIAAGLDSAQSHMSQSLGKLLSLNSHNYSPVIIGFCPTMNMSTCAQFDNFARQLQITVFNPLAHETLTTLRIPVKTNNNSNQFEIVSDADGLTVKHQLVPIPQSVLSLAERPKNATATHEIVFVQVLKPLDVQQITITRKEKTTKRRHVDQNNNKNNVLYASDVQKPPARRNNIVLHGKDVSVTINATTGLLQSLTRGDKTIQIRQSFYYYQSWCGINGGTGENRSSGAYVFRPTQNDPQDLGTNVTIEVVTGLVVSEVRQTFTPWLSQSIRVYADKSVVEFDWTVGPIPVDDHVGKEIITRFESDLETKDVFWTDSNGRRLMQRHLNFRPSWKVKLAEPISGNYYPVTAMIQLRDLKSVQSLTVFTDRSQGGSSLKSGQVELMIHRRCLCDDHFGVTEPLNEPGVDGKGLTARGTHVLLVDSIGSTTFRQQAQQLYLSPIIGFVDVSATFDDNVPPKRQQKPLINATELPTAVHLLTAEFWDANTVLLRLENSRENSNEVVTLYLQKLFSVPLKIVQEMKLGVNRKVNSNFDQKFNVTLNPLQIRTFLISIN